MCFILNAGAVARATADKNVGVNHELNVHSLDALRSGPDLLVGS